MTNDQTKSPKKIGLFLGVSTNAGGMFQYSQTVLEALSCLDKKAIRLEVVYISDDWENVLDTFKIKGFRLKKAKLGQFIAKVSMTLCIPSCISRYFGIFINPLIRELIKFKCDIWIFPSQDEISYQYPEPFVGTIHDLMHRYESNFPEVKSFFRYRIREHRFKNISKHSLALLVDSQIGKQQVIESYGTVDKKIYSIPYIAPRYIYNKHERVDFDAHYKLPSKFLFYPAQFWMHKNHIRLINAVKSLKVTYPEIALVLSGSYRHNYNAFKKYTMDQGLSDNIYFIGYVPDEDISGIYKRARALVMPTFFGPTNIPPLEAMACACPAVLSGIYGMREQSGEAALYFDPMSEIEMTKQIEKVWNDDTLVKKLSINGLERDKNNRIEAFSAKLLNVINSV